MQTSNHLLRALPSLLVLAALTACRGTGGTGPVDQPSPPTPVVSPPTPVVSAEPEATQAQAELGTQASLADYRAWAAEANPGVRAAYQRWLAATERGAQRGALPDPRLTYRYFLEEVETRVGPQEQALGLAQTLPWPGRLRLRQELADAEAESARARYQAQVAEVLRSVDEAWYDAYFLGRSIEVVRSNRDLLALLEEVLRSRYSAGEAEFADLIRAQVELGKLEDRLATLEDQRRPLAARLNATLDRAADTPLSWPRDVPRRALGVSAARVVDWVRASSPEFALSAHELEREERAAELARLEARPDLTLGLEWIDTGDARVSGVPDSGKDPWIASLSVNLPVWGGRVRAAEEEARARRRAASLARESVARRLESDVETALYQLRDAERRAQLYGETLLSRAQQSFEAQEAAFRAGGVSFLELVDAERTLLEFELALERARTDQAQALSHLERLAGRPLETLDETPGTDMEPVR